MNQPCFFLFGPAPCALQGSGQGPSLNVQEIILGGNTKPAISHRGQAVTCVLTLQGNLLRYMGRESPQCGRQEEQPMPGPTGLWGSTQAVTTERFFIAGSPISAPTLQLPWTEPCLGQNPFFAKVSVLSPFSQPRWPAYLENPLIQTSRTGLGPEVLPKPFPP